MAKARYDWGRGNSQLCHASNTRDLAPRSMSMTRLPILLIEDNENDVLFMNLALEQAGVTNPVHVVKDGQEALDYLGGTSGHADRVKYPLPYLVVLDLKLPYVMGLDVLKWMRERH